MTPTARIQGPKSTASGLGLGALSESTKQWIHWDFTKVNQDEYDKMKDMTVPEGAVSSTLPPSDKITGVVADATAEFMRQNQISHTIKSRQLQWSALGKTATVNDKWVQVPQMNQSVFDTILEAVKPKVKEAILNQTEIGTIDFGDHTDIVGLETPLQDLADFYWEWWLEGINRSGTKLPAKASGFDRGIQRYLMIEVDNWGESGGGGGGGGSANLVRVRIKAASRGAVEALKLQYIRSAGGQTVRSEGPLTIIADVPAGSVSSFQDFSGVRSVTPLNQGGGGSGGGGGGWGGGGSREAGIIRGVSNSTLVIGAAGLLSITLVAASS